MGVDLSPIIIKHERSLSYFQGKKIAIDAFNSLYQFLASIRQPDGTPLKNLKGEITSHLSGIFYRTINLIENGIEPIYVFDGEPPEFKKKEIEKRKERKFEYKELVEKAKDLELNDEVIKSYTQAFIKLEEKQVKETKELLKAMGVFYLDAPSEGEAQSAYMAKKGYVYASASQDYDSLLFGAPVLVRNLSISGRRKLPRKNEYVIVHPEEVFLDEVLKELNVSLEQLIYVGILVGTDFNKGVKGIGAKTAVKLVKNFPDFEKLRKYVEVTYNHEFEDYIEDVIYFFKNPPVVDPEIEKWEIEEEKVMEILVERHDFSSDRVKNALEKLKRGLEKKKQSTLSDWFG